LKSLTQNPPKISAPSPSELASSVSRATAAAVVQIWLPPIPQHCELQSSPPAATAAAAALAASRLSSFINSNNNCFISVRSHLPQQLQQQQQHQRLWGRIIPVPVPVLAMSPPFTPPLPTAPPLPRLPPPPPSLLLAVSSDKLCRFISVFYSITTTTTTTTQLLPLQQQQQQPQQTPIYQNKGLCRCPTLCVCVCVEAFSSVAKCFFFFLVFFFYTLVFV